MPARTLRFAGDGERSLEFVFIDGHAQEYMTVWSTDYNGQFTAVTLEEHEIVELIQFLLSEE